MYKYYKRKNEGSERLSNLPSVTQHKVVELGFRSRELASSAHPYNHSDLNKHGGLSAN